MYVYILIYGTQFRRETVVICNVLNVRLQGEELVWVVIYRNRRMNERSVPE